MNADFANFDCMDFFSSSDYGSASSIDSELKVQAMFQELQLQDAVFEKTKQKSSSFDDLRSPNRVDDVMNEFRMIGSDSPYEPQDDEFWEFKLTASTPAAAPSSHYHRQKSWPGAEKSQYNKASASGLGHTRQKRHTPADLASPSPLEWKNPYDEGLLPWLRAKNQISQEQLAVLQSLPDEVLHDFLEHRGYTYKLAKKKATELQSGGCGGGGGGECRFCANNGERAAWVRSHALKDARGHVTCPVLRAFVCPRCGASGDRAHTIKYCPLSTEHERQMSAAMMRSVRLASGRKRIVYPAPPSVNCANYDATSYKPATSAVNRPMNNPLDLYQPLDPVWAALEKKLAW